MSFSRRSVARAVAVLSTATGLLIGGLVIAGAAAPPPAPKTGGVAAASRPLHCSSITYVRQASVGLTATATDPDSSAGPLSLSFQLYSSAGRAMGAAQTVAAESGATATASFSLPDGTYYYAVTARDSAGVSAPSTRSGFVIDTTVPAGPSVTSFTDPLNSIGVATGGTFTLHDPASSGAIAFTYSFDSSDLLATSDQNCATNGGSAEVGWTAATSGTATLAVPSSLPAGPHTLWVSAIDAAHHESSETEYAFQTPQVFDPAGGTGLLEAESLHPTVSAAVRQTGNTTTTVGTAAAIRESSPNFGWSGNGDYRLRPTATVAFDPTKPLQHGAQLTFPISLTVSGLYSLGIGLTTFNHYGTLQFRLVDPHGTATVVDDPNTGKPISFDGYSASLEHAWQALGFRALSPGTYRLVVTVVGKDARSADHGAGDNGLGAGVDYVTAIPFGSGPAVSPFAAQNNDGIAADGTAANIAFGADRNSLSENALAALGWGYGSHPTVDGVSFSVPPQNGQNDNIVAAGQNVLVSSAPGAKWLDLLVLSTSGATPTTGEVQMNYTNGNFDDATVPSVPDWWAAPAAPTSQDGRWQLDPATSGLRINLNGAARANTATVYHLRVALPSNSFSPSQGLTLQSVDLPNYDTRFRPGSNALHILGIGTSS